MLDAAVGLPGSFDVITMFDGVHDAVDPLGLLRSVRDALGTGGRYLRLGITCSDQPSGNTGPIASLLYGFSILYCMTTSLAEGVQGLGTLGLPEPVLRRQGRLHTGAARRHGQPVQQPLRARAMRAGTMASTGTAHELLARASSRQPVQPEDARVGAVFERIVVGSDSYFVKQLSAASDWITRVSGDHACRP